MLVNNASAIYLTGTLETPMKRFDLMHQVNTRGTFLCSQKCVPHLLRAANPHVLNLAPPLNLKPRWFAPHVAYTMAKYGMSLCVLGMAEEFRAARHRRQRAVAAHGDRHRRHQPHRRRGGPQRRTRKAAIMADAAHAVLTRPSRERTGHFLIDDEVLRDAGVTDLSRYRPEGAPDDELMRDFFLDEGLRASGVDGSVRMPVTLTALRGVS